MAREIKFQVMDSTSKETLGYEHFNTMLNDGYYYVDLSEPEEERVCHTNYSDQPMLEAKSHPMATLLRRQFTGLKDKNDAEIYEGDVVECWDSCGLQDTSAFISGVVSFNGGCFCVRHKNGHHNKLALTCAENVEVIGNIHQNPELLECRC